MPCEVPDSSSLCHPIRSIQREALFPIPQFSGVWLYPGFLLVLRNEALDGQMLARSTLYLRQSSLHSNTVKVFVSGRLSADMLPVALEISTSPPPFRGFCGPTSTFVSSCTTVLCCHGNGTWCRVVTGRSSCTTVFCCHGNGTRCRGCHLAQRSLVSNSKLFPRPNSYHHSSLKCALLLVDSRFSLQQTSVRCSSATTVPKCCPASIAESVRFVFRTRRRVSHETIEDMSGPKRL